MQSLCLTATQGSQSCRACGGFTRSLHHGTRHGCAVGSAAPLCASSSFRSCPRYCHSVAGGGGPVLAYCKRLSDAFEFSFTSSWLFCHSNFHIEVLPLPRKRSQGQAFCGCSHLAVSPTLCRAMLIAAAVPVAMSSLSTGMSASRQQCLQPWLPLAQACRHGCVRQYIMPWCFEFDQYVGLSEVPAQSVQVAH